MRDCPLADTKNGSLLVKGSSFGLPGVITVALSLLLTPLPATAGGSEEGKKVYGEVRPDAALVYICGGIKDSFFYDDQLFINMSGYHSRCAFTHVSPGTHVLWDRYVRSWLFDFAAGQTYYLGDNIAAFTTLPEAEGQAKIRKAKQFVEPTQKERSKAASTIAKKWPLLKQELESKLALTGGVVYTPPTSTDGIIRIPAGTAMSVELMENLNSGLNVAGESVWFRIAEDALVDDRLFVRAGTPVRASVRDAHKNSRWGKGGDLDVTMISVTASDGTICPLIGQASCIGAEWLERNRPLGLAAYAGGNLVGLVALNALMKGAMAFIPAGATVKVFTRQDIWIRPPQASGERGSGVGKPPDRVRAYARSKIACNIVKGEVSQIVEIVFEGVRDIASAELFEVAGWQMPTPMRASSLSRVKEEWIAQFGGHVCRFLRLGDAGTQLAFRLTAADGTVAIAQGTVLMSLQ